MNTGSFVMRNVLPTMSIFGVGFMLTFSASATTIIPFANLSDATANSQLVVTARAVQHVESDYNGNTYQDTYFEVLETVKGDFKPGEQFLLRPMSHRSGDYSIDIAGDFGPVINKTYLLFLYQKGDVWAPVMLSYYVFEQVTAGSEVFLVPIIGDGIEVVGVPGMAPPEPLVVYQKDQLLKNLQLQILAPGSVWDGNVGRSQLLAEDLLIQERAVPVGCDFMLGNSTALARWQNPNIPIYYDDTGVPANWSSTFASILSGMNSNYTGIQPFDAGQVSYTPNCTGGAGGGNFVSFCNSNLGGPQCALIMFEDPCNEIPPLSGCSGVLAFGGSYATTATHIYDGQNWQNARYGYLIVNNGATCLGQSGFELLITHELTHVYRMDHLSAANYPNQNMNPSCCNNINNKDRECMNYAYPGSLPVELSSFDATLMDDHHVRINWVTQSENENEYFTIRRSADGYRFDDVVQVPSSHVNTGSSYGWTDDFPMDGVNYYMLSQTDLNGNKINLGIKAVTLEGGYPVITVMPNPVQEDILQFRMSTPFVFDGMMEVVGQDGRIVTSEAVSFDKGTNWVRQQVVGLSSGIYALRVYDARQQWSMLFTKK